MSVITAAAPRGSTAARARTSRPDAERRPGAYGHRPEPGRRTGSGACGSSARAVGGTAAGRSGRAPGGTRAPSGPRRGGRQQHRPLRRGVARLGDDVPGRAVREQSPAEPAAAVAEVVPQRRGDVAAGERAPASARRAARVARAARAPRRAAASAVGEPDRPPVAAVRALLLDRRPRHPSSRSRAAISSAARRSPSDADGRSNAASSWIASRQPSGPRCWSAQLRN